MDTKKSLPSMSSVTQAAHAMQNVLLLLQAHTEMLEQQMKVNAEKFPQGLAVKEVQSIYFNTRRLSKLLDSLLIYDQADNLETLLHYETFDICALVIELIQEYRRAFPHVLFSIRLPATLMIEADKQKITIAIRNVLENAIKYGGNMATSKHSVSLVLMADKKRWSLVIKDYGTGIDSQDLAKVFLPFYRGRAGINKQGSGLGLAITNEIVRYHKGRVDLQSGKNDGVEVSMTIPLSQKSKK